MSGRQPTIAVLDDEPKMRTALRRLLQSHGYAVVLFENGPALLTSYPGAYFDCILLDLQMPEMSGFEVLEKLTDLSSPPVVVITGNDQPTTVERVRQLGALAHLTKPVDETALLGAIQLALRSNSDTASSQTN